MRKRECNLQVAGEERGIYGFLHFYTYSGFGIFTGPF